MGQIQRAIDEKTVYSVFQPIVELATQNIYAYECLARSTAKEFPHPGVLFNTAIEERAVGALGRALRQKGGDDAPEMPLFINIHPYEFDEGFLVRSDDALFFHDHPVYLEVTESVPLSHFKQCHGVLKEIRDKGIKLAIDDLGAGYSNLVYIADLIPDIVKLDMELVRDLDTLPRKRRIVSALVNLCEQLDARVVAEGVETKDELRAVIDCGAHFAQGFLLARPSLPAPTINWPL